MKWFNDRLFVIAIIAFPATVNAGTEAAGTISQLFYADEQQVYYSVNDMPPDAEFFPASNPVSVTYYGGQLVITETMQLQKGTDIREGSLLITIDLGSAQTYGTTPIPNQFVHAEYRETQNGVVVFRGSAVVLDFWVTDFCSNSYEFRVVGQFVMIFADETGAFAGCRVFKDGHFSTNTTPDQCHQYDSTSDYIPNYPDEGVYVEECGCDGSSADTDTDTSGCGGESDSEDSSGCAGDTSSDASSGSGCAGDDSPNDSGGSDCSGDTDTDADNCAIAPRARVVNAPYHNGGPLRALSRWLPELIVLLSVSYGRSKARRNCSAR